MHRHADEELLPRVEPGKELRQQIALHGGLGAGCEHDLAAADHPAADHRAVDVQGIR